MSEINTGVEFNFSYAPGVSDDQILGFEIAGDIWSQHLADSYHGQNLEINIFVEATDEYLPDNIVGGSFPAIETRVKYEDVYNAIQNDITTDVDVIVADSLLNHKEIDALVGGEIIDKNAETHVTTANLKALGLLNGDRAELDGYILLNNFQGQLWSYDYLGAPQEGKLDFLSMAQHELGHIMGFISGANHTTETVDKIISNMTTMDLFRYSTQSVELGINDMTYGEAAFFSIDGQVSTLELTTGETHQVGHLAESPDHEHTLMSPAITLGDRWSIEGEDLLVLDAIGWDVVNPGAIDMAAIYNNSQVQVASAEVADLRDDVEQYVLSSEAYNWGSASSGGGFWWGSASSGGGFWWGSASSGGGFWQEGYFLEMESTTEVNPKENNHQAGRGTPSAKKFWDSLEIETSWVIDNYLSNWLDSSHNHDWWDSYLTDEWWDSYFQDNNDD